MITEQYTQLNGPIERKTKSEDTQKSAGSLAVREHPQGPQNPGKDQNLPDAGPGPILNEQAVVDLTEPKAVQSSNVLSSQGESALHRLVGKANTEKIKEMYAKLISSPGLPKEAYGAVSCCLLFIFHCSMERLPGQYHCYPLTNSGHMLRND